MSNSNDPTLLDEPPAHDFLQDIATFYFTDIPADALLSVAAGVPTLLDGITGQKVLWVACHQPDNVFVGLEDRVCLLNTQTNAVTLYEDAESAGDPDTRNARDVPLGVPPVQHSMAASDWLFLLHTNERDPVPTDLTQAAKTYTLTLANGPLIAPLLVPQDNIPVRDVRCCTQDAGETLWIGGAGGAARLRGGVWSYFGGRRWLPDDRVNTLALDSAGRAWIGTDGGLACIASVPMTWEAKAAHYEAITAARHNRDGFVTECLLTRAGDVESHVWEASDNDGLWTSLYLCAECFRWAVTGEPEARALAQKSLRALLELLKYTGISGFPARAIHDIRGAQRAARSEPAANWRVSPLDANVWYKADTSSDEVAGHYLAWFVYGELCADEAEKSLIADACRAMTDHILDHDYTLVGPEGRRTSWGVWTPDVLNHDPQWAGERGLGSLEMLSHLRVALHLCPCDRYRQAYRDLVNKHGYALNTVRQKVLPPHGEDNHSDDELAAIAYYPLLRLETEPRLRALYLLSLERTKALLHPARSPFHNVIYQACTGRMCDVQAAREWLQNAPLDLRDWAMRNSGRPDVALRPETDRFHRLQTVRPLPPSELGVMKWNRNPFRADWDGEGTREMDGAFWLLPYWMGRYYGVLSARQGNTAPPDPDSKPNITQSGPDSGP